MSDEETTCPFVVYGGGAGKEKADGRVGGPPPADPGRGLGRRGRHVGREVLEDRTPPTALGAVEGHGGTHEAQGGTRHPPGSTRARGRAQGSRGDLRGSLPGGEGSRGSLEGGGIRRRVGQEPGREVLA